VRVHGLEPRQGETAYAFLVLRFGRAVMANVLMDIGMHVAPICPDAEQLIGDLPAAEPYRILALPWTPPEAGSDVELQRRLIEYAAQKGVDEVWCFQVGTSVPSVHGDDDEQILDDGLDGHETQLNAEPYREEEPYTQPIQIYPPADAGEDGDLTWSNGAPPTALKVKFPVDGFPQILDDYDWEDFGLALKLEGSSLSGEDSVLAAFHTLWLTPYGGRYRNANVTFDRRHHAVHLWVDRFEAPGPAAEMIGYLLWIASKLDEVLPVVHARFAGASMQQKYGGIIGDTSEAFVLGGNPLVELHTRGGDEGVDTWLEEQTVWSNEEVAQMLRELAIDIVTGGATDEDDDEDEDLDDDEELDDDEHAALSTNPVAVLDPADLTGVKTAPEVPDRARGSGLARMADELLIARAKSGRLDPRAYPIARSLLISATKHPHRQRVALELLGWAGDRESVPAIIAFIEANGITGLLESVKKGPLLLAAAEALGRIGDVRAIPVLAKLVIAPGRHNDSARPAAAHALATLLESSPEPRTVDESVFDAIVSTIDERNDHELQSDLAFAFGRLARLVSTRSSLRLRLEVDPDAKGVEALARLAARFLAGDADPAIRAATQKALHEALTVVGYSSEDDVLAELRLALRIAAEVPDLVDATSLVALTAFEEPSVRAAAHALLARLGCPAPELPAIDRVSAQRLADDKLVEMLGEPVLAGRASLIRETERRRLSSARGAVVRAAHAAIDELTAGGHNLARLGVLRVAAQVLAKWPLESDTAALFQRMRRHDDHHVQEMAEELPDDVSAN
jgi:hypothetical protein